MKLRTFSKAQVLCGWLKENRPVFLTWCGAVILLLSFMSRGSLALANEFTNYARDLEKDLSTVLDGRLNKQQYLVTAEVTAVTSKGDEKQENSSVPFLPFKISRSSLKAMLSGQDQGVDYLRMQFELTLMVDVGVPEQTLATITALLNRRYSIDNSARRLTVARSVLIVKEVLPVDQVGTDTAALERSKLESEKARAVLESERIRLEMERIQMSTIIEREALLKKYDEEKSNNEKKLNDLEDRIKILANPVVEPKSVYKEFQWAIISGVIVMGVLISCFVAGYFLRAGMSTLSDGVKSVGSGVGNAMIAGVNAKLDHDRAVITAAKKDREAAEKSGESQQVDEGGVLNEDWVSGNQEFEVYVAKLQDKIEILSREKNFLFVRRFVDYGETDSKIGVAASILLALPRDTGKTILDEVPVTLVDKLQSFLATPVGLTRAKSSRKQAIQDFYGAIALDEFSGSPLMSLNNLGWLTRMSSLELATMIGNMDTDLQPVLLSCLTQSRIMKIIDAAPNAEIKNMIVLAIANTKNVDEKSIGPALKSIQSQFKSQDSGYRKPSLTNSVQILKSVIFDLEPAQQDKLIKDIGDDQDTLMELAKYYVPFRIIGSLGVEWIREILSGFTNPEIAIALFDLSAIERSRVINALPGIQAETLTTELLTLDQDVKYQKRNKINCHKIQKEISGKIIALRNSGVLEINWPADSAVKKAGPGSSPYIKGVA